MSCHQQSAGRIPTHLVSVRAQGGPQKCCGAWHRPAAERADVWRHCGRLHCIDDIPPEWQQLHCDLRAVRHPRGYCSPGRHAGKTHLLTYPELQTPDSRLQRLHCQYCLLLRAFVLAAMAASEMSDRQKCGLTGVSRIVCRCNCGHMRRDFNWRTIEDFTIAYPLQAFRDEAREVGAAKKAQRAADKAARNSDDVQLTFPQKVLPQHTTLECRWSSCLPACRGIIAVSKT